MPKELWQRSFNELIQIPNVRRSEYKKKRKTKTELIEPYQNKKIGVKKLPQYNTQVSFEPKANETYEIVSADEITTRNNLTGVRVEMKAKNSLDKRVYSVTVWPSDQVSNTSKWGAFVSVLGSDTDKWPHKWIRIVSMQARLCEIILEKAPKLSVKEAGERIGEKIE